MGSRIKELREKRGIIQAILAAELGITQQMLSKYERDIMLSSKLNTASSVTLKQVFYSA